MVRLDKGETRASKMRCLVIVVACFVMLGELSQAAVSDRNHAEWTAYKLKHGKIYASQAEDASRMANFLATKERVDRHNAQSGNTYVMALNHLADWSSEERAKLKGLRLNPNDLEISEAQQAQSEAYLARILGNSTEPIPDELDWRQVPGRVSPVGDQGNCGSCWPFSAIGVLEGQQVPRNITNSTVIPLSIQELVDCSLHNLGCGGGWPLNALYDAGILGGIESDKDYPYKYGAGTKPWCKFDAKKVVMKGFGGLMLPKHDEDKLKEVVATYGPVSVGFVATDNLESYHSGVFDDYDCGHATGMNHAMLIVGYGTDENYDDYWIVKNSWGKSFGEKGYVKVRRGSNMCAIAMLPLIAEFN